MVIFSMGGLTLRRHANPSRLRCRTGLVALGGPHEVVIDPYPARTGKGVVGAGQVRVVADDVDMAARAMSSTPGGGRWDDLDLLEYAAASLWTWVALPLLFELEPRAGVQEITVPTGWPAISGVHRLTVDESGAVTRHEEGDVVHGLSGHCEFGGALVATRRRTRTRHGVPVAWADLVAAHMISAKTLN